MITPLYFGRKEHDAFAHEVKVHWHPTATAYAVFCPVCGPLENGRHFALVGAAYDRALNHRLDYGRPVPRGSSPWGPSAKWGPSYEEE